MDAMELIRNLHAHRMWANHLLLEAAESLSGEQLRRTFPIGRGSIWKSLLHLYAAEWGWWEVLHGDACPNLPGDLPDQLPGNQEGEGAIQSLDELKAKWHASELRWEHYLSTLDSCTLEQLIQSESDSAAKGTLQAVCVVDVLLHLCTYSQYTTAQVDYILQQSGVKDVPDSMLITWARRQMFERKQ